MTNYRKPLPDAEFQPLRRETMEVHLEDPYVCGVVNCTVCSGQLLESHHIGGARPTSPDEPVAPERPNAREHSSWLQWWQLWIEGGVYIAAGVGIFVLAMLLVIGAAYLLSRLL